MSNLSKNRVVFFLLTALCLIAYINILPNDFTLVDDKGTFVDNPLVHDFWASIRTFKLQDTIYTIFYHLFGANAIPLHIMSIGLHIVNTFLFFLILKELIHILSSRAVSGGVEGSRTAAYTKRKTVGVVSTNHLSSQIAFLAAALFAVHPVNTEAVTWISGNGYLLNALFFHGSLLTYLRFKQTKNIQYFIMTAIIFITALVIQRNVWIVLIPGVLLVIDQFILNDRLNFSASKYLLIFIIPLILYAGLSGAGQSQERLAVRPFQKPLNQQKLIPVIESAPYTIFTMAKLYLYPKDLMIYYDGNPVTPTYYTLMFIGAALYFLLFIFLWKKNRPLAGMLIILALLLGPLFSPVKFAWYMAERYLYYGTGFFCALLVYGVLCLEKTLNIKKLSLFLIFSLVSVYTFRTILRNQNYLNSHTLAQATIRTSPHGIRGYDDMGGAYLLKGDYKKAIPHFNKSLSILPDLNTPINNLGYIYILYETPRSENEMPPKDPRSADELYNLGFAYNDKDMHANAFFYLYQALRNDPNHTPAKELMAEIYIKAQRYEKAKPIFEEILKKTNKPVIILSRLAFVSFQQKKYAEAESYLNKALQLDPTNAGILQNLQTLEKTRNTQSPSSPLSP